MEQIGVIKDRVKMSTNPYREYSICEISGVDIKNPLHEAWEAGYKAKDMEGKVICNHADSECETIVCDHKSSHSHRGKYCSVDYCNTEYTDVVCIPVAEYNERKAKA